MTRVLVIGATGQLGRELALGQAPDGVTLSSLGRDKADLCDPASLRAAVRDARADWVVNAAAYTAVDRAEEEPAAAYAANMAGPRVLAEAAMEAGAAILHVSTDYVFDGSKRTPWSEDDPVGPLNVYGASKLAGELAVAAANPRHLVLRVSWVFAAHGRNFARTMLRLGREREHLNIVDDQIGRPTSAADIASAILQITAQPSRPDGPWGVRHFSNGGEPVSWRGFAEAIFDVARPWYGEGPAIAPITTEAFPTPARRPLYSVLDTRALERDFAITPRPWRAALVETVAQIAQTQT